MRLRVVVVSGHPRYNSCGNEGAVIRHGTMSCRWQSLFRENEKRASTRPAFSGFISGTRECQPRALGGDLRSFNLILVASAA